MPTFHGERITCLNPVAPDCGQCTVSGTPSSPGLKVRVPRTTTEWYGSLAPLSNWLVIVFDSEPLDARLPPPRLHPASTPARTTPRRTLWTLRHIPLGRYTPRNGSTSVPPLLTVWPEIRPPCASPPALLTRLRPALRPTVI